MQAYLALGSNMGDRWANLEAAVKELRALDPDLVVSPVYETTPVGGPPGQGDYLNCVVALRSPLGPRELLSLAKRLENEAGRVRGVRNGPRPLDVDILLLDDLAVAEPDLVIPHPRMNERAFVLAPLEDLAPELVPPDWRARLQAAGKWDTRLSQVGRVPAS